MHKREIFQAIELQTRADKKERSNYPDHVCGQVGIVAASAGRLMQDALDIKYDSSISNAGKQHEFKEQLKRQAIKTASAAIRFLENLK